MRNGRAAPGSASEPCWAAVWGGKAIYGSLSVPATDADARDRLGRDLDARKATLGAPVLADKQNLTNE